MVNQRGFVESVVRHIGLCVHPNAATVGSAGSLCGVPAWGGWVVLLDFHLAPPWAAFPPVLANDASLMLHGSAEQSRAMKVEMGESLG